MTPIIYMGDCIQVMRSLPENCVDAVVCDPPYNLESIQKRFGKQGAAPAKHGLDGAFTRAAERFIGLAWDDDIAFKVETWTEVMRVMKPGAYVLACAGSTSYDRCAFAMRQAGFIIHPIHGWIYGTGLPKPHPDRAHPGWWFGTQSTKPALEPVVMAQKPKSERVMVENIARWGTGAINVDACRVVESNNWPANLLHDDSPEVMQALGEAAPFFYCAKANKEDRCGSKHPTCKPVSLMQYLCRLITPPGGTVLDPFAGTGTTGAAALREGFQPILIEQSAEYVQDMIRRFAA
jgi:site-specific DNA-methyltransferase (adenine-specific)